jgi:uncharacterized membrane protein YgcG
MQQRLKQFVLITLTFLGLFTLTACSENAIVDKPENSAVYDQAKVLSTETIQTIDKLNEESDHTDKKLKISVYIVNDLHGDDLEETTLAIARKWKIGDKDTNNGVLLFLAIKDKESRLEVSDNLTTRLTDNQAKAILENMKPKLRNKDYDGAVLDAVKSIVDVNNGKTIQTKTDWGFYLTIAAVIVILIIITIATGANSDSSSGFWSSGSSSGGGFDGGGFSGGGASSGW